jgi:hypothetical protein
MNEDIDQQPFPPLSPTEENPARDNFIFVRECLSKLGNLSAMGQVEPRGRLLTQSKQWGLVFRVDFTVNQEPVSGFVNRLVCWKEDNGSVGTIFAIGQDIKSL